MQSIVRLMAVGVLSALSAPLVSGASERATLFADPPSRMRVLPCHHDRGKGENYAKVELDTLERQGFGGMTFNACWDKTYLRNASDLDLFAKAAREAHARGMTLWLYDEYGYPSGTAERQVLEGHPEWQARGALIAYADAKPGETVTVAAPPGETLLTVALPLVDGKVDAAKAVALSRPATDKLTWKAPSGVAWRVCVVTESAVYEGTHAAVNVMLRVPYINLLRPEPVKRFIEVTHERYAALFGRDEFARIFTSTFTDEPSLMQWVRPMPYLNLPWCAGLADDYRGRTGRDLVADIPRIAFDTTDANDRGFRGAYWKMLGDRIRANYTDPLRAWCKAHGIESGGHLLAEEAVGALTGLYGDFFGVLRGLTAPGVDCLSAYPKDISPLTPLYASSAAALNGSSIAMCEYTSHGATPTNHPSQVEALGCAYKLIAGGITQLPSYHQFHAFKTDAEKRTLNERIGRALAIVDGTVSAAEIALYYPTEALQSMYVPGFGGGRGEESAKADANFKRTGSALYAASRSFLIVDAEAIRAADVRDGALVHGKLRWRAVVLPWASVLNEDVVRKLEQFRQAGGTVLVTGKRPDSSPSRFPDAKIAAFGESLELVPCERLGAKLREALPPALDAGAAGSPLRVLRRKDAGGEVFFVYNDSPETWKGRLTLASRPTHVELWRPVEGDHRTCELENGALPVEIAGYGVIGLTTEIASPEFSRAGYWAAKDSPRLVRSMNPGWEFSLDEFKTVRAVNLPHAIDEGEIGLNASGGVNRQQPAWYRKTFAWRKTHEKAFLHFEAIMGKSRVSINGRQVAEHFGGFLPIHVDVTDVLKEGENTIVVWCDNSNDPTYPPGKAQDVLDWTYFGGMYRDCWLVETGAAYVTDSDRGGVYVTSRLETDGSWTVDAQTVLGGAKGATCEYRYDGQKVVPPFKPRQPKLWTPDTPNLHTLEVRVFLGGRETDAVAVRFGIRDFKIDAGGMTLNGKPWRKVVGVNRHQDFAFIGMALANSLHWRDAKKYRDAGFTAIRNAHYPQDPAFMDACDALGLMVIVNPPGWQFWNKDNPVFEQRVYDDIRKMVRRDRSRASLWFWEPILNETCYPDDFARNAYKIVKSETQAPNYCACDPMARGAEGYDVIYSTRRQNRNVACLTREWGDYPDDWNAQNSPSRTPIEWGEGPMLVQADHYTVADYPLSIRKILDMPSFYLGGCMWHGADHSRGYHPDNFFGGVLSYTRRKKYSYYACKAMLTDKPFVYLANQLAIYSPQTLTIYSNCAYTATWLGGEVKNGDRMDRGKFKSLNYGIVHPEGKHIDPHLTDFVITLADGSAVTNRHAGRFGKITLELDTEGLAVRGDGSDLVVCIATMCDTAGRPRRYQTEDVVFSADGPVQIVGENPQRTRWGEAAVLLRPLAPGPITVTAALTRTGTHLPQPAAFTFVAATPEGASLPGKARPLPTRVSVRRTGNGAARVVDLSEVEKQQRDFGLTQ